MVKKNLSNKNQQTWFSYIKGASNLASEDEGLQLRGFESFFPVNGVAQQFFRHNSPFLYLLNYRTGAYMNMSENFAGYSSKIFLEGGLEHTFSIFGKDDLKLLNEEIFPDRLALLKQLPAGDHRRYIFTVSADVKNNKGGIETYLQRNAFVSDTKGNPIYSIGLLVNINHLYPGEPVIHTVEKLGANEYEPNELISKRAYYKNQEDKIFSKAEKRVLTCMADGMSSKMIAERLFLSEHTVFNHRRNMQIKANAPNSVALVTFALRNRLI